MDSFYLAGATLGRGLNRGLATFLAALLGFGAHRLASLSGEEGEPIILAIFVFLIGTSYECIKLFNIISSSNYDSGYAFL